MQQQLQRPMCRVLPSNPWIVGLCAVTFDVDIGQKVKFLTPDGCLSEEERAAVAFHSFPDSMSMELYARNTIRDSSFLFRVRRTQASTGNAPAAGASLPQPAQHKYLYGFTFCRQRQDEKLRRGGEQNAVVVLSEHAFSSVLTPLSHILGPLYFAEGPGVLANAFGEVASWPAPVPGGLMQLAVGGSTISARVPIFAMMPPPRPPIDPSVQATFTRRASRAHSVRRSGSAAVPTEELLSTPPDDVSAAGPGPGSVQQRSSLDLSGSPGRLGLAASSSVGSLTHVDSGDLGTPIPRVPSSPSQLRRSSPGLISADAVHGVFAEVDVYTPLQAVLRHLWTLWELLLLGEALMVAAPTPSECSGAVAALLSLIAPLPYARDFRPYYTIHDPSAQKLTSGQLPSQDNDLPTLIGVTNLFFVKGLPTWPNVLAIGQKEAMSSSPNGSARQGSPGSGSMLNPGSAMRALKRRQQGAEQLLSQHTQELWGSYKALSRPDAALVASLAPLAAAEAKGPVAVRRAAQHSRALRRHFGELTAAFLTPFKRYFEPGPDGMVPRWQLEPFLASIAAPQAADGQLLARLGGNTASLQALYRHFTATANFREWFRERQRPVEHMLEPLPTSRSAPGEADDEVELVQAFVSLELQLQEAMAARSSADGSTSHSDSRVPGNTHSTEASSSTSSSTALNGNGSQRSGALHKLQRDMVHAFFRMSTDLKTVMISSPQRRQLLQSLVTKDEERALQQLASGLV